MEQTVARNVALLFEPKDEERMIELSTTLDRLVPSDIVLNPYTAVPHVSLRQLVLPEKNIRALQDIVRKHAVHLSIPTVTFDKIEPFGASVFLMAEYSTVLKKLHKDLLYETNELREGHTFSFDPKQIPQDHQNNLLQWGMALIGDALTPHVTLSRPRDGAALSDIAKAVEFSRMSAKVRALAITGCDDLGRATEIYDEWKCED